MSIKSEEQKLRDIANSLDLYQLKSLFNSLVDNCLNKLYYSAILMYKQKGVRKDTVMKQVRENHDFRTYKTLWDEEMIVEGPSPEEFLSGTREMLVK